MIYKNILIVGLLIIGMGFLFSGCTETPANPIPAKKVSSAAENSAPAASATVFTTLRKESCQQPHRLTIGIDGTGSGNEAALKKVASSILNDLPALSLDYCIDEIEVIELTGNGLVPEQKLQVSLPIFAPADDGTVQDDSTFYPGVNQAKDKDEQNRLKTDWETHAAEVLIKLGQIDQGVFLSKPEREPRCSDVTGFLRYLSEIDSDQKQIILLVTDGQETCSPQIPQIDIPQNTSMSIFVLPLTQRESGSPNGLDNDYEIRRKNLQHQVSRAAVVGYQSSVAQGVREALTKSSDVNN